jgi:2-oxoglutarate ferredoxin oxidoreductase subunit delta
VDEARCKGCALCTSACQQGLISLAAERLNARGYHPAQFVDPRGRCTGCTLCAVICPDSCITVYRAQKVVSRRPVAA